MKKIVSVVGGLLVGIFLLSGCSSQQSATDYSSNLIKLQSKVGRAMTDFGDALGAETPDPQLMTEKHTALLTTVSEAAKAVEVIKPFNGDNTLKDAIVKLFQFYQDIGNNEFKEMLNIMKKPGIQEADVQKMAELSQRVAEREKPLDLTLQTAMGVFVQKNNLKK